MDSVIRPTVDEVVLSYRRWAYVHGIPSIKEIFSTEDPPKHPESYQYYFGNIRALAPIILKPHSKVWN